MSRKVAEFIIYIINEIANSQGKSTPQVYKVLSQTGCISNYLVPFYDVLHTMSSQSVAEDVLEYVESRGGKI